MEQIVTGCTDCPLWDCTGEEYGTYCHHPNAATRQRLYESGSFVELPFKLMDGLYQTQRPEGTYSVSVVTECVEIERGDDGDPITPNWCPLNKDSITIIKQTI